MEAHKPRPNRYQRNDDNDVYFRCRADVDIPASHKARTAFIPIELYFRDGHILTAKELERACVDDRKIISLFWNFSFETRRKTTGVTQWFQHNRRCDSGFPFKPGPAARIHVPKNTRVQVQAGCRLGAVVAVVNAGMNRLQEEYEENFPTLESTVHQPSRRTQHHNRRFPAGPGAFPGPSSTCPSSASSSL